MSEPALSKATEIPMSDCGLSINCGEDGVWLHFKASDGKHASLKVDHLVGSTLMIDSALSSWCADRQKQAAEIRASVKE